MNFIVNEKIRKQNIDKKINSFNFENIIRNKAKSYSHSSVISNTKKLDALSKSLGKYFHLKNKYQHNTKALSESEWINATKNAILTNNAILNKTLNLGNWYDNNSNWRDTLNSIKNNKEWKKAFGKETMNKIAEYSIIREIYPFTRI